MTAGTQPVEEVRLPIAKGGWIALVYLILYAIWLLLGPASEGDRLLTGNLAMVFPALAAACLSLWLASHSSLEKRLRRVWFLLGGSLILWILNAVGAILRGVFPSLPLFWVSVFNLCYLAGCMAALTGLLIYPRPLRHSITQLRLFGDVLIATAAVLTLCWLVMIQPIMNVANKLPITPFYAFFPPLGDLLLLIVVLDMYMLAQVWSGPGGQRWVSLGLGLVAMSDLVYSYLTVNQQYQTASLVDLGRAAGFFAIGMAVLKLQNLLPTSQGSQEIAHLPATAIPPRGPAWDKLEQQFPSLEQTLEKGLQSAIPFLATFVLAGYATVQLLLQGQADPLSLWMTALLGLFLVARQGMRAGEREFQQYTMLVNSIAEPAFICDGKGRLKLVNPALLNSIGYLEDDDLFEKSVQRLLLPDSLPEKALQTGLSLGWSGEATFVRKDGSTYPVYLSLRPIHHTRNERLAMAGTAHDLTLQKSQQNALREAYQQIAAAHHALETLNEQLEQKVEEKTSSLSEAYKILEQQNQTLQMLDELKSDFVSLVSHELRAPLTNISGGIELVLGSPQAIPRRVRQSLTLVQVEIRRLTHFVETILDLSALDAGRMPLSPAPLAVQDIIEVVQHEIKTMPGAERVGWEIPKNLPFVLADDHALVSIFFHLIDNANKYAPGGVITVRAEARSPKMQIQVIDQGPGIPPEAQSLLFGKFYRLHRGDSQTVYGHGLGLYIVRRLLQAMQGDIQFNNRPEGGACFTFCLPLIEEKDEVETFAGG
jgi:PAS domain S-box-containing protein